MPGDGFASSRSLFDLGGRVALVTGARRGLGFAIAQGLASAGARTWIACREETQAHDAIRRLATLDIEARPIAFDIEDEGACAAAIHKIAEAEGRIDILVNNAAVRLRRAPSSVTQEDLSALFRANVSAPFILAREAADIMTRHGWGRIIMISSLSAQRGPAGHGAYAASKGAVEALMRSLASEYGPLGITCNAIAPGKFATEINRETLSRPEALASMAALCPLGRHGEPHEIVGPCLFLASEASSYVNGHVLTVDGGYSIRM